MLLRKTPSPQLPPLITNFDDDFALRASRKLIRQRCSSVGEGERAVTVRSEDAEIFEREFHPEFNADHLQNLPKHNIYMKLSIDGSTSSPFSAETIPSFEANTISVREKIIDQTRQRYCVEKRSIESKIEKWLRL